MKNQSPSCDSAILLIDCPDRPGIVAAVAQFLYLNGGNILHADQHQDNEAGMFFMRVEWSLQGFKIPQPAFQSEFELIARQFDMHWSVAWSSSRPKLALFVSRYQHCLIDLLHRHQGGEFAGEIALIISNHRDASSLASFYGIPFHFCPMMASDKAEVEQRELELLAQNDISVVVLARYMQVLSPQFVARYPRKIINVHHSFLPAFMGAKPYHAAFERGVKLIGATSHL